MIKIQIDARYSNEIDELNRGFNGTNGVNRIETKRQNYMNKVNGWRDFVRFIDKFEREKNLIKCSVEFTDQTDQRYAILMIVSVTTFIYLQLKLIQMIYYYLSKIFK